MKEEVLNYIPLDKSWIIRMGVLDLINKKEETVNFLENQKDLNSDLKSLLKALKDWNINNKINVGESGTIFRFLQFTSWKFNLKKEFIKEGTLKDRKICNNPDIVNWPLKKLLELDNNTSQWASASVLCGNLEIIENPPFKLKVTYDAIKHWKVKREKNESWESIYDQTIKKQAEAFKDMINKNKLNFFSQQAEDYCFARAFNLISKEEGERKWPSLRHHESDRIEEMENQLKKYTKEKEIDSKDHRVTQAIAMLAKYEKKDLLIKFPESVDKSWPQFWKFLKQFD